MVGVETRPIPAEVVDLVPVRDRTDHRLVRHTVDVVIDAANAHLGVAVRLDVAAPHEALAGAAGTQPEALRHPHRLYGGGVPAAGHYALTAERRRDCRVRRA